MGYIRNCLSVVFAILLGSCFCKKDRVPTADEMQFGYDVATKVGQGICWYEFLKVMPDFNSPKTNKFGACYLNMRPNRLVEIWTKKKYPVTDYEFMKANIGANMNKFTKTFLKQEYFDDCRKYMLDPIGYYDEQHSLINILGEQRFPYRSWSNCMLFKLEEMHGEPATEAMRKKWTEKVKPWAEVLLNRENDNRKRHESPPLVIEEALAKTSQQLADQLATACGNYSQILVEHDMTYNDEPCGMNIYLWNVGTNSPPQHDALHVANTWYESGQTYPWPVYSNDGSDSALQQFGQFTQSVWKGTQKVGYGMGKSENCNYTIFVGKYFPRGNVIGEFQNNVLPRNGGDQVETQPLT